ncbi:hypothetical protein BG000_008831 [Podila horticola]|nr:hypothetical protein BG000_008831 [Podila horticola]
MKSLPDEDAGFVFWEDFCNVNNWPEIPNITNIRRYTDVFVNDKEKKINQRRGLTKGDEGYLKGHDLFVKPVLRFKAQLLKAQNVAATPVVVRMSPPPPPNKSSNGQVHADDISPVSTTTTTATTRDPCLPHELQVMIVALLDDQQDLHFCTLVSHDWHTIFNPILWNTLKGCCNTDYCDTDHTSSLLRSAAATGSLKKYGHHIRSLAIECLDEDFQEFLTLAPERLSQLRSIELIGLVDSDDMIADLLWRCSQRHGGMGLRRVVFNLGDCGGEGDYFAFGEKSFKALMEHVSTLEVFCVESPCLSSKDIQQLLCSTPRLRVFNILSVDRNEPIEYGSCLNASDVHTEWACTSLRVFGCPIRGIPRPDVKREVYDGPTSDNVLESNHQKSLDLQKRIYCQLARLTHLRELRMGISYDTESQNYRRFDKENERQHDCLAMSLKSGLDLLSGLKSLRVVALEDMEVSIDDENEKNWVAQNWPRVDVLTTDPGTDRDDDSQLSGFDSDDAFERHWEEWTSLEI